MANEEKTNKKIYENVWFWIIVTIVVILIVRLNAVDTHSNTSKTSNISNTSVSSEKSNISTVNIKEKVKVTVIDFSQMSKEEIQNWCTANNVKCKLAEDYSDTIEKGLFANQNPKNNTSIYEGDTITITYSLGKKPSMEELNALKSAESYSKTMHMSKARIYKQLTSEYGENFTSEAAQYAIDHIQADWNANALATAKTYQTTMHMSKQRIYQQLISSYGEEFTKEEAQYAIDHLDN